MGIMIIIGVIIIIIITRDQLIVGINTLGLIAVKRRENGVRTEFVCSIWQQGSKFKTLCNNYMIHHYKTQGIYHIVNWLCCSPVSYTSSYNSSFSSDFSNYVIILSGPSHNSPETRTYELWYRYATGPKISWICISVCMFQLRWHSGHSAEVNENINLGYSVLWTGLLDCTDGLDYWIDDDNLHNF